MHEQNGYPRAKRTNSGWIAAACGMGVVLLITLLGWSFALTGNARAPLCYLSCNESTARPAEPPEGAEFYGWNGFYEVELVLQNEGEQTLLLPDYALEYQTGGRDGYAWAWSDYSAPLLTPTQVLPAGQRVRYTALIEVSGEGSPESAFPLTVRFDWYDAAFELGRIEAPQG